MKFLNESMLLIQICFICVILNQASFVENRQLLRKFNIQLNPTFVKSNQQVDGFKSVKEQTYQMKAQRDKQRKDEEKETKRKEIIQKFLFNSVSSSVLRDFYSRF